MDGPAGQLMAEAAHRAAGLVPLEVRWPGAPAGREPDLALRASGIARARR